MNLNKIQNKIKIVKKDMFSRFPSCSYTINVVLWDDGTDKVECKHANNNWTKLYISTYYNNKLTFEEIDLDGRVMVKDEKGNDHYKYLTDDKPI